MTGALKVRVQKVMKDIGLNDYFDILMTVDDVSIGKLNPECFSKTVEKLKVLPTECVVFEDTFNGIESAKLAGVEKIVGVMTNYSKEELEKVTSFAIPNFKNISVEDVVSRLKNKG